MSRSGTRIGRWPLAAVLVSSLALLAACPFPPAPRAEGDGGSHDRGGKAGAAGTPAALDAATVQLAHQVIDASCLTCHDQLMLRQQRLTRAQWKAVIEKMHRWGAPLSPRELDALVAFAAETYQGAAGVHRAPALSAAEVDAQLAPLPDGPFARGNAAAGRTLFQSFCASCHGTDATGTAQAPNLVDRPILYRAPELAAVVRGGRGRMPWFPLDDAQLGNVVAHLRTLE